MKSLRLRFLVVSALSITLVLAGAGFIMIQLFEKNLERRVEAELTNYVNQIAADLNFDKDGRLLPPKNLSDRRFELAYSGLYWQLDDVEQERILHSRSLWDFSIELPADTHGAGEIHRYILPGPDGTTVTVEERELLVSTPLGVRPIRISAAMNYETITSARSQFALDMIPYLFVLGAFLLLASTLQLTLGLRPLKNVRSGLNAIRNRKKRRLSDDFPNEIRPLTEAINKLLDEQDETIDRARKQASNLAHGLNTPLTVLVNDAEKLEELGQPELSRELLSLAKSMRMHVDFELARSRMTPEQGQRSGDGVPFEIVGEIVKTLQRTPKGEGLNWVISIPKDVAVSVDPEDLRELLGNIIENAVKWTETKVIISATADNGNLSLSIEDDGKGLEPKLIESILVRGIRHDQKTPGTGIGLSLVHEICDINDIDLTIENRQSHGLCVSLVFDIAE